MVALAGRSGDSGLFRRDGVRPPLRLTVSGLEQSIRMSQTALEVLVFQDSVPSRCDHGQAYGFTAMGPFFSPAPMTAIGLGLKLQERFKRRLQLAATRFDAVDHSFGVELGETLAGSGTTQLHPILSCAPPREGRSQHTWLHSFP